MTGATEAQIANTLAQKVGFDLKSAQEYGASDSQIAEFLSAVVNGETPKLLTTADGSSNSLVSFLAPGPLRTALSDTIGVRGLIGSQLARSGNVEDLIQSAERKDLSPLQLSASGQTFNNQRANGYSVGGRIGYNIPFPDDGNLNVGLTGSLAGATINTPNGPVRIGGRPQVNGLDATYRQGNQTVSANLGLGPDKRLMVRWVRKI
ncbi:MAG: hypothetical protein HY847_10375 [Betaproteobacteria bacterium]|nr:hypothetical protein [Betaproteobacteria bacterium]